MITNLPAVIMAVQHRLGVHVDGDAGSETWTAIANSLGLAAAIPKPTSITSLADELVRIAVAQLGTQEDAAHTNRGAAIAKYQAATNLSGQGWAWCAAFVDWCIEQLLERHPELAGLVRPRTAAAFGLIDWAHAQKWLVFDAGEHAPQPGDIVVYKFSHCGIVRDVDVQNHAFHAIEGNSNADGGRDGYEVVNHARNFASVKAFIRLPQLKEAA